MILLDAYALVAIFRDEPAADEVERLLQTESCSINAVNLAEAVDRLVRIQGAPPDVLQGAILSLLEAVPIGVVEIGRPVAVEAGLLRARYYRKASRDVSLADCLLLASALAAGSTIATGDRAVISAAEEEGLAIYALP